MWIVAVTLFLTAFAHASVFHCPYETICHEEGAIEANSFQFLDKLGPKQYQNIIKLAVVNASQDKLPAKLKYLRKLEYLDLSDNNIQLYTIPSLPHLKTLKLSRNNIKGIQFSLLPRNLEELDLSNNLLSHIPKDWSTLRALKILHLQKNFFDCDCFNNNVLTYKRILAQGIEISDVNCYLPKQYYGKNINSINCTIEDEMINDQPEGSGASEDIFNQELPSNAPYLREDIETDENEVIDDKDDLPQEQPFVAAEDIHPINTAEEGSGDLEGSGFMPIEIEHVAACVYNCATPDPIGANDNKNDSGAPGPTDQIKIIAEDVLQPIFAEPTPSTSASTTTGTEAPLVKEEAAIKSTHSDVYAKIPENDTEVDISLNETRTGEMEKATALNQNNYAVYIVLTCGLLLAVVFLVYLIKKRKARNETKNRRGTLGRNEEEMTPLEKASIQSVNEKYLKSPSSIPEHIPLINGQNGKPRDEPILKSFTPLEHPECNDTEIDEPAIREKPELLTPLTERVTIRASEIPESILKTPVLVHRQKNSEGEIVTRVLPP